MKCKKSFVFSYLRGHEEQHRGHACLLYRERQLEHPSLSIDKDVLLYEESGPQAHDGIVVSGLEYNDLRDSNHTETIRILGKTFQGNTGLPWGYCNKL